MKKIILSVLSIFLTIGLVGGTAYALFTDNAEIQGVTITSGNADLQFELGGYNGIELSYWETLNLSSFSSSIPRLYPGFQTQGELWLRNNSASIFPLSVFGKLTSAGGDWVALSDKIEIAINAHSGFGSGSTDWHTLAEWNSTGFALPTNVPHKTINSHWGYDVYLKVKADAGNEISGKTLSNIVFTLTGTQL